ncbi:MAG: 50S ribosomal protein L10 [Candidatus Buchananbacteria bacterium]|nr:50S ribosomal protein L10 [Candidatus Buchananbacteria bacterium]
MPKTKQEKKQIIQDLVDKFSEYKSLVFTDYKGLTVAEAQEIRELCKEQNAEYIVAKKTLIQQALDKAGIQDVDVKSMDGNVALVIGFEDEVTPAKIAANFAKDHESLKLLGGIMEDKYIDLSKVEALAKIPSKAELLSKLVGSLNSPISGFVNVLAGNLKGLVRVLNAIKEQKA